MKRRILPDFENEAIPAYNFDVIIVGSDQVWNKKITMGYDNYYWGNFEKKESQKVIAYAPSMEEIPTNEEEICSLKNLVDNFDAISVRELQLKDFLSSVTNRTVTHAIDPTFLWLSYEIRA